MCMCFLLLFILLLKQCLLATGFLNWQAILDSGIFELEFTDQPLLPPFFPGTPSTSVSIQYSPISTGHFTLLCSSLKTLLSLPPMTIPFPFQITTLDFCDLWRTWRSLQPKSLYEAQNYTILWGLKHYPVFNILLLKSNDH